MKDGISVFASVSTTADFSEQVYLTLKKLTDKELSELGDKMYGRIRDSKDKKEWFDKKETADQEEKIKMIDHLVAVMQFDLGDLNHNINEITLKYMTRRELLNTPKEKLADFILLMREER